MANETTLIEAAVRDELQWALRRINSTELAGSPLAHWLTVNTAGGELSADRALRKFLLDGLDELKLTNVEGATILRRHYVDDVEVHIIARELALVEGTINKKQREAVTQWAGLLARKEDAARSARRVRLAGRLETPTYTQLFGVERALGELMPALQADGPPWLLAIEGVGGLGKTALADCLVRHSLESARWADVAWVTARQQMFNAGGAIQPTERPALTPDLLLDGLYEQLLGEEEATPLPAQVRHRLVRQRLRLQPVLVVVDNLETAADVRGILAALRDLVAPSKFLVTTRHSLLAEGDVFPFRLSELAEGDALAFVRWEAQMRNLPALAAAPDDTLRSIYTTAGGNPLALRLIVGQTHIHALGDVIDDLQRGQGQRSGALYTYIYRQAWENLDAAAREVLLLMPLVGEQGADLAYLAALSGREPRTLRTALDTLVTLSLVDRRGGVEESRYTIHSLTRTFLHEHVLQWGASGAAPADEDK